MVSVNEPLLSVIIVSFNTRELILSTLESVLTEIATSSLLQNRCEVIVVDNNSSDGSLEALQEKYMLVKNSENLGFAKANNIGIEKATGEYILLLNSDTIVQSGALEKMVQTFEKNPITEKTSILESHAGELDRLGILAAELTNPDGSEQRQGGSFPTLFSLASHMLFLDDIPLIGKFFPSTQKTGKSQAMKQLDWVGGTAMMVRRAVFQEIGTLDQNIFMYGEDIEFCMRAKNHHWDVAIEPDAKILHIGGASSSLGNAVIGEFKGYIYIWAKHKPVWQMPLVKLILKAGAISRIVLFGTILNDGTKADVYRRIKKTVLQ